MKKLVSFVLALLLFSLFATPAAAEKPSPYDTFDLLVKVNDIFWDPKVLSKGQTVTVGANIQLVGTKAFLDDLLTDLGLTGLNVRIEADPGLAPIEFNVTAASFNQDYGQATISTTWNIPADTDLKQATIKVTVDPYNQVVERKENNNTATRQRPLKVAP